MPLLRCEPLKEARSNDVLEMSVVFEGLSQQHLKIMKKHVLSAPATE